MKKKVIAILLSLSMIVGIMPTLAFATSGETTPVSETTAPTESTPSVCPVCQTENCTAEHKQCEICESYDCAKTHVFCETCEIYDCGVDHSAIPAGEPAKCETCGEVLSEGHICPTDPVCSCSVLCKADAPKSDCPVCSTEGGVCTGSGKYVEVQAMIDALRTEYKESEREAALAEYEAATKAISELSEEEFALLDLTNYYAAANPTVIPEENIVCYIGEKGYASLSDALTDVEDNAIIVVHENITSMPTISKPVTIKGYAADRGIQVNCHIAENFPNVTGTVTFENLTFNERISTETSATSQGNMTLKFVNCTFNVPAGNTYAIQAGASGTNDVLGNLEISQCTFNAAEKAKEGEASTFTGGYMIYAQCVKNVSITDCIINGKDNYRGAIHLGDSTAYATTATVSGNQISGFCRGIVIGNRVTDSSISISGNTFTDIKYNSDDSKQPSECAPIFIHENANAETTNVSVESNAFNSIQNTYVIYNENTAENESSKDFIGTFTGNTVNSGSVTGETQNVFSDWGAPTIGITAKAMTKNYGADLLESNAGGTVSQSEETETWAAAANSGYEFKGWFTDEACTKPADASWVDADNKLTPQKNSEGLYESGSFYALFEEKTTTVTYKVVDTSTGSVCFEEASAAETITDTFGMVTGSPKTATAKPVNGYMFVGWYTDESCTVLHSTNAALNSSENGTFYAKFIKDHATVTITKTIDKASSSDQSFILNISGTAYNSELVNVDMVIVIPAGQTSGSAKVVLPACGNDPYTISDPDTWNWRYRAKANASVAISGGDSDKAVTITSTLENGNWFADFCVYPYKKES